MMAISHRSGSISSISFTNRITISFMKLTANQHKIINVLIQVDPNGAPKVYPLGQLETAHDIFKAIWKNVEGENFVDGEVKLSSEQKVFITRLIDERQWSVVEAESIFKLKELLH